MNLGIGNALSPLASTGSTYDFTRMTAQQAFDTAKKLSSQGQLCADAAARLEGAAEGIDYVSIDRSQDFAAHTLADPTMVDWVGYMQQSSNWMHANAGSKGVGSTDDLLAQFKAYRPTTLDHTLTIVSTRV